MLANGTVDDQTMQKFRQSFSLREILELTMTSAFYTAAIVQFSQAVGVGPEKVETIYTVCKKGRWCPRKMFGRADKTVAHAACHHEHQAHRVESQSGKPS